MTIEQIRRTPQWAELTDFQRAVYEFTYTIPRGETRSYKEVAVGIGRPNSARAVGNALHVNPFAPDVLCHRVVKSDGSLGGFAYGTTEKEKLLKAEQNER